MFFDRNTRRRRQRVLLVCVSVCVCVLQTTPTTVITTGERGECRMRDRREKKKVKTTQKCLGNSTIFHVVCRAFFNFVSFFLLFSNKFLFYQNKFLSFLITNFFFSPSFLCNFCKSFFDFQNYTKNKIKSLEKKNVKNIYN